MAFDKKEWHRKYRELHREEQREKARLRWAALSIEQKQIVKEQRRIAYLKNIDRYKERARRWEARNKDKVRQYGRDGSKRYKERIRAAILKKYGGRCQGCGIDDKRVLCLDHVFSDGNEERRKYSPGTIFKLALKDETGRYQLLCFNCNNIKKLETPRERGGNIHAKNVSGNVKNLPKRALTWPYRKAA